MMYHYFSSAVFVLTAAWLSIAASPVAAAEPVDACTFLTTDDVKVFHAGNATPTPKEYTSSREGHVRGIMCSYVLHQISPGKGRFTLIELKIEPSTTAKATIRSDIAKQLQTSASDIKSGEARVASTDDALCMTVRRQKEAAMFGALTLCVGTTDEHAVSLMGANPALSEAGDPEEQLRVLQRVMARLR